MTLPDREARAHALYPKPCIVQAPAGSGKTTLLASRFIRLLCIVEKPQEILAITFTKKAAAEMRQRVLNMLKEDDEWSAKARERNNELGWNIFNNPNVLKIQTIDSFAMELASQTHDRELLGRVEILEDASRLYELAAYKLIEQLVAGDQTAPVIADFLALHDNDTQAAVRLIVTMLAKRDQWLSLTREISTNIVTAPMRLDEIIGRTIETIRYKSMHELQSTLHATDFEYMARFTDDSFDAAIPSLMTKNGTLRRRFTSKDEVGNPGEVRELNQWLSSLHERGLSQLFESHCRLPQQLSDAELESLTLTAVVLTLAAVELRSEFSGANSIDFVELLIAAKNALRDNSDNPTDLALLLDYRIKHLLVDEYQDTSRPQFEFLSMLCETWRPEDGNTLFTVGDPMQSIYRFRDADVRIFSETIAQGIESINLTAYQLTANFRSSAEIVNWCNNVFENMFTDGLPYSPATPMQESVGSPVECVRFEDAKQETRFIVDSIQDLIGKNQDADIAILCRARTHLPQIIEALRERNIPWQASDIDSLSEIPLVQDLHTCLRMLLRPRDPLALASLLRSPLIGMTLREISAIDLRQPETLRTAASQDPRIKRLFVGIDWARPKLHQRSIREVLQGFWLRLGGSQAYASAPWEIISAYLELLDRYGRGEVDLEDLDLRLADLYAPSNDTANVQIMTIHKSKGLEFDHVFVPVLNHRTRPDDPELISIEQHPEGLVLGTRGHAVHDWLAYENREKAKAEEKRLLYVACTRAKRSLTLTWSQDPERKPTGLARYLEPYVEDRFFQPAGIRHDVEDEATVAFLQTDLFETQLRHRIPRDYIWPESTTEPLAENNFDHIENRTEVATGTLVHKALAYLSGHSPIEQGLDQLARLLPSWNTSDEEAASIALGQVQDFVKSELGQWCLMNHESSVSELPITGVSNEEVRHIVVDRMFVVDGVRWILDYKSTQAERITSADDLVSRYRSQLNLYAEICGNLYSEPIRTALVLTDTATLLEIG